MRPLDLLVAVGARLQALPRPVAFLGGATTGLHVTDPASPAARSTRDVDVIVDVADLSEYATRDDLALVGTARA